MLRMRKEVQGQIDIELRADDMHGLDQPLDSL
jgi:hypothetical protein